MVFLQPLWYNNLQSSIRAGFSFAGSGRGHIYT